MHITSASWARFVPLLCIGALVASQQAHAAPQRVTNLVATLASSTSIQVRYTIPQPGGSHTLVSNDVRISTTPFTTLSWPALTNRYGQLIAPGSPGAQQTVIFNGLEPVTQYYIALKTLDSSGTWSPLSNIAVATTTRTNNSVTLSWTWEPEENAGASSIAKGFNAYSGVSTNPYPRTNDVGYVRRYTFEDLEEGTNYLAVSAYNADRLESDIAPPVIYVVEP